MSPSVSVRLFGGAAEAFGATEVESASGETLASLVGWLIDNAATDRARLREVLDQCSFFVDGDHCRELDTRLPAGARVDVLPPFAGG